MLEFLVDFTPVGDFTASGYVYSPVKHSQNIISAVKISNKHFPLIHALEATLPFWKRFVVNYQVVWRFVLTKGGFSLGCLKFLLLFEFIIIRFWETAHLPLP